LLRQLLKLKLFAAKAGHGSHAQHGFARISDGSSNGQNALRTEEVVEV
jgi:hypothetical protein